MTRPHVNAEGLFQSDKYPTCPAGKVPLSVADPTAQDLLWDYAQRRRAVDAEFADDLEQCLREAGFNPEYPDAWILARLSKGPCRQADFVGAVEWARVHDACWSLLAANQIRLRADGALELVNP